MRKSDAEENNILPRLARASIAEALGQAIQPLDCSAAWLQAPGASFVTLTRNGALRGCIGTLEAWRPLAEDVRHNAVAAALRDPRFPPLDKEELAHVRIEVSVLGMPRKLCVDNEAELCARLRPGVDGVILQWGQHRATFLPQVWEQLPNASEFLAQLKRKAGLPADFWHPDLHVSIYQVEMFREPT